MTHKIVKSHKQIRDQLWDKFHYQIWNQLSLQVEFLLYSKLNTVLLYQLKAETFDIRRSVKNDIRNK